MICRSQTFTIDFARLTKIFLLIEETTTMTWKKFITHIHAKFWSLTRATRLGIWVYVSPFVSMTLMQPKKLVRLSGGDSNSETLTLFKSPTPTLTTYALCMSLKSFYIFRVDNRSPKKLVETLKRAKELKGRIMEQMTKRLTKWRHEYINEMELYWLWTEMLLQSFPQNPSILISLFVSEEFGCTMHVYPTCWMIDDIMSSHGFWVWNMREGRVVWTEKKSHLRGLSNHKSSHRSESSVELTKAAFVWIFSRVWRILNMTDVISTLRLSIKISHFS